jgi:hypothetical protein
MFVANLEQMIVDVGVRAEVLQTSFQDYSFLTAYTWMAHLWEFLEDSKSKLKHDIEVLLRSRHDQFLMPAFRRYFTKSQLQAINRCRLYLQVSTLAEIVTADGMAVTALAMEGQWDVHRPHYYGWPTQPRPSEKVWKWWRHAVVKCFTTFGGTLQQPLGVWTDTDETWEWFHCSDKDRLYQRTDDGWRFWIKQSSQRRKAHPIFFTQGLCEALPTRAVRANVSLEGYHCRLLSSSLAQTVAPEIPAAESIDDAVRQLDPSQRWSVQDVRMSPDQGATLAQAIIDGDAIAVSDGSFKDEYSTAEWTLRGKDDSIL